MHADSAAPAGDRSDADAAGGVAIAARTSRALRPLSPEQLRLWRIEDGGAARDAHSFAIAYDIHGPLDEAALRRAVDHVAGSHHALRERVVTTAEGPCWHDDGAAPTPFETLDRSAVPMSAEAVESVLRGEATRTLDARVAPPWRCVLLRRATDAHVLLLQFHHLVADRWSVGVFVTELGAAYSALVTGGAAPAPALAVAPVAGVAPAASTTDAEIAYWRRRLAPPLTPLVLPGARRGGHTGHAGDRVETVLDPDAAARLRRFAAAEATTLFPVVLATFGAVLHAHTGQSELLLCTPVTGRQDAASRRAIGFYNRIVPLRLDLGDDPDFRTLVARVGVEARAAYTHQSVAFDTIALLDEAAGLGLTRCLFAVQNTPGLELRIPGARTSHRDVPNGTANFDLSVFLEERAEGIRVLVDFKTGLFDRSAIERLVARFVSALAALPESPLTPISSLGALGEDLRGGPATAPVVADDGDDAAISHMVKLWRLVLRAPPDAIGPDTDFFDAGGDSMLAARLFTHVGREFNRELPLATLFDAATPRRLVARLSDARWVPPWTALVPVRTTGRRPPIFFIAGGGGNVLCYRTVAACLGEDQPVYCLQPRGLRQGDAPLLSIEGMASHYVAAIRGVQPRGPYLVAGHSVGAVIAYEMAQRLIGDGDDVALLGLLDHPGPGVPLTRGDWLRFHLINLSMLEPRDRLRYLLRGFTWRLAMRRSRPHAAGEPDPSAANTRASRLATMVGALRDYELRPYPGQLTLLRAAQGSPRIRADPLGGWGATAAGGVRVIEVPGTHLTMLEEPHVRELGAQLAALLDELAHERQES
jgi:thioesterase domain-containing protein